jgi:predicted nuclease of predicted toxin-antitoxin system
VRWLIDECMDAGLVTWLRDTGHDVAYMAEIRPAESDTEIVRRAQSDGRLLFTEEKISAISSFGGGWLCRDSSCCALIRRCMC